MSSEKYNEIYNPEKKILHPIWYRQDSIMSIKFKKFFICSWGGCGSTMLQDYLLNFGLSYHIHDPSPPTNLKYAGKIINDEMRPWCHKEWAYIKNDRYYEHFSEIDISNEDIHNCYMIFIYRNPIYSIYSRFYNKEHLKHIDCDPNIKIEDIINAKNDLYNIINFFKKYKYNKRNYKIIFIKYETIFDNWENLNNILGIPNISKLFPEKKENLKIMPLYNDLENIYKELILEMNKMNPIEII